VDRRCHDSDHRGKEPCSACPSRLRCRLGPQTPRGRSAVITGKAQFVTDREEIARLEAAMVPWLDKPNDMVVRIRPQIIDGFRLAAVA
jgi:hypothetical protein